jgi:hypothetical protein
MSSPARMCGDAEVAGDEKCDTAISQGEQGACPTKCEATKPCTRAKLTGSECQARCEVTEIKEVVPGDGCCLANSDAVADSDCLSVCGNGVIEPGETCDPVASCATKVPCAASDACEPMRLSVDANKCTAKCEPAPAITACKDGDQCCPKGQDCTHATDSDCMPSCGDGVVDTSVGETCEPGSATPCPSCDDGNDCTTDVRTGSATTCNVKCAHAAITEAVAGDHCCPSGANNNTDSDCVADCGNGVVEADERCDGNCPASDAECDDHMACTIDRLTGTGCQRRCTYDPRAPMLVTKDECCPTDASAATDADCVMPTGNLVAGRTFTTPTANSTETQSFPVGPESITDGKLGTRWISALESMVTLTVDLGATYTLTRIRIVWAGNTTKKFSLRIASRSGQPGTEFYAGSTSGVMTEDIEYTPPSFVPPTGRYFQIYCADRHRNDYGNSIWEVEVYGTPAVPP